ncbi:ATP-binding cassette sub-family G member 1 [Frankliniella fusca]|uniref:ATP-binding cassette sub-family G member 1 n=1 Tax=Frankliniella fusca TaxID=407009 RepID=A0AAE1LD83_9NEOP|nr:ATP-binding cassette sub-family G member 1 [Frankliniella fusca]
MARFARELQVVSRSLPPVCRPIHTTASCRAVRYGPLERVGEILALLGLDNHAETLAGRLSGGQKKRLSIALELISNPPIIFLDEPTTGLDSSSTTQCVSLLKSLAAEGRTVVCTIHQPSALLFEMFDQLYAVAAGRCVYQGDTKGLVPFLAQQGLPCPAYHNPADFLMEVSTGDFGVSVTTLSEAAAKHSNRRPVVLANATLPDEVVCQAPPAPLYMQFYLLLMRNIIIMRRDVSGLALRVFMHVFIGLIFGYLYRGVGANANDVLANVVYLYGSNLFLVYTGQMAVTLAFPLEVEVLTREHFNRWYKLGPYLLSTLLVELPIQAVLCATYLAPSIILTEQPLDLVRIVHFYSFATLASLTAQSCGFLFGASVPITISVFLGPVVAVLLSIFGFCIWYRDIPYFFMWLYYISYFRAAFQGCVYAMYAYGRTAMPCPNRMKAYAGGINYCHYKAPRKILNEMDIADINFWYNTSSIIAFCVIVYIVTITVIWFRLNRR